MNRVTEVYNLQFINRRTEISSISLDIIKFHVLNQNSIPYSSTIISAYNIDSLY